MKLTWLGHSCFKVESQGYRIVLDPYETDSVPGYRPVEEQADQVLCSHGHQDHAGVDRVAVRRESGPSPFQVETVQTWHDDAQGAIRGTNTIHILDDGRCRIAHLGDLGCALSREQQEKLRGLDALLIPVGGYYTIDAAQAKGLVDALQPRVVIPMHYRSGEFGYDVLGTVEQFTDLCDHVVRIQGSELELTPETERQVAVLRPKNV